MLFVLQCNAFLMYIYPYNSPMKSFKTILKKLEQKILCIILVEVAGNPIVISYSVKWLQTFKS